MREDIMADELADIRDVNVNENLPKQERIAEYIRQIRNPYHYKCGKINVRARFNKNGPTIEECLQRLMA